MGRSPCCEKIGLKKGPWTPEEDQKLLAHIEEHGHGSWRALPSKAGLQRCGKSCRLRWTNYLRPDIKRGKFSLQEEQAIIQLHALLGNRWSAIATHLTKRTDNEIKNYWNTHLKKRLAKMGIDPVTHKAINGTLTSTAGDKFAKSAANVSHMAQWESARLEAEARLARESKMRAAASAAPPPTVRARPTNPQLASAAPPRLELKVVHAWQGANTGFDLEPPTPTSTVTFTGSNNNGMLPASRAGCTKSIWHRNSLEGDLTKTVNIHGQEISEGKSTAWRQRVDELEGEESKWRFNGRQQLQWVGNKEREENLVGCDESWFAGAAGVGAGFTGMLLELEGSNVHDTSECWGESNDVQAEQSSQVSGDEECKNYWNSIFSMVNVPDQLPSQSAPLL